MIKTVVIAFHKGNRHDSAIVKTVKTDIAPLMSEIYFKTMPCEEVVKLTKTTDLFNTYPNVSWGYICA